MTALVARGRPAAAKDVSMAGVLGTLGMLVSAAVGCDLDADLALDGAEMLCLLSAWPVSRTAPVPDVAQDRQARMFDLYDAVRAVEKQVFVVSANLRDSRPDAYRTAVPA